MITFKKEYSSSDERSVTAIRDFTMNVDNHSTLPEVLEAFEYFLRGCGYHFNGEIDIVNDFENEPQDSFDDIPADADVVSFSGVADITDGTGTVTIHE